MAATSNRFYSVDFCRAPNRLRNVLVLVLTLATICGCSSNRPAQPAPEAVEQQQVHEVKTGETLYSIAKLYQLPVAVIVDANHLVNAAQISAGDTLQIPGRMAAREPSLPRGRVVPLGFAKAFVGALAWPCASKEISSRFGKRSGSFHEGLDIRARPGTPVYAAHDGKVVYSGKGLSGYGRLVAIRGDGIMTVYAHNSKNFVDKYEYVKRGDQIAESGDSGDTTGPHLHFEVRLVNQQGRYHAVDPMAFFP